MDFPPSSHFVYIPAILILGIVLGFLWGARATREAFQLEQRRAEERAQRRAARAARATGAGASEGGEAGQAGPDSSSRESA